MIRIRRAEDRGHLVHGWLDSCHTFSFGHYHDPHHEGFRALRVMNEDRVQPGEGFGEHPHDNMEIISYVLAGELAHKDSMGNGSVLGAGDLQRLSAGTGVRHSEFNPSPEEPAHFYQIWLLPDRHDVEPSYAELREAASAPRGAFRLVASPDGASDSLRIHQDARIHLGLLDADHEVRHDLDADRHAWLQVLRGEVRCEEHELTAGDGVAFSDERVVSVRAVANASEVMLFDLP